MKIKSKLNGEVSNVRADIAREMVNLGVAELLEPDTGGDGVVYAGNEVYSLPRPGGPAPEPHFSVGLYRRGESSCQAIVLKIGNVERVFSGRPDAIHDRFEMVGRHRRDFCSALGFPVPPEILKEYLEAWKRGPRGGYAPNSADVYAMAQRRDPNVLFTSSGFIPEVSNDAMAAQMRAAKAKPGNEELNNLSRDDEFIIKQAEKQIAALEKL